MRNRVGMEEWSDLVLPMPRQGNLKTAKLAEICKSASSARAEPGTWRSSSPVSRVFPAWVTLLSRSSRLMILMTSASSKFLDGSPSQVLKIRYG